MRAFSREVLAEEPPRVASTVPADTRLPTETLSLVISPLPVAVTVWLSLASKVPLEAQATAPILAVAVVVSVRAPGFCTWIFTWRTRLPPAPTWSAGAT